MSDHLAICVTCGTQYDEPFADPPKGCKICDVRGTSSRTSTLTKSRQDPRQYVPPTGQQWTSLAKLKTQGFKNVWTQDAVDERVSFIQSLPEAFPTHLAGVNLGLVSSGTAPKIGIGQRAIFLKTEHGNVLWDLVPFIDEAFVKELEERGGLKAIVVSCPLW